MTIQGEITFEDYLKFVQGSARPAIVRSSIGFLGLCLMPPLIRHRLEPGDLVLPTCFFLILATMFLVHRFLGQPAEKNFLKIKSLHGLRRIEMNADGIAFASPTVNFTERWAKHFRTYSIVPGYTVLYEAGYDYQIFPQRWFTDDEYTQFQTYLRNSLGQPGG